MYPEPATQNYQENMKKLPLIALLITFLFVFSFGQEQELDKHFKKVDVVKIDTNDTLKKVSERKPIKIGQFDLMLKYIEIRSKNFKSEVTTAKGREIAEPVKINTVQGTVMNAPDSYVAITIDENLEGLITTSEGMFFVERADKYDNKLSQDNFVIYKQGDKKGVSRPQTLSHWVGEFLPRFTFQ